MINEELLNYIKKQKQKGISNQIIKDKLTANGWQTEDIDSAFALTQTMPERKEKEEQKQEFLEDKTVRKPKEEVKNKDDKKIVTEKEEDIKIINIASKDHKKEEKDNKKDHNHVFHDLPDHDKSNFLIYIVIFLIILIIATVIYLIVIGKRASANTSYSQSYKVELNQVPIEK